MDDTFVHAIADLAQTSAATEQIELEPNARLLYLPMGDGDGHATLVDLEQYQEHPHFKRGLVMALDAASFVSYWRDHSTIDSRIYVDTDALRPAIVGVLDHHAKGHAGWGTHRVAYGFRKTPEWSAWVDHDGKMMSQQDFAEFIEDNVKDMVEPAGADMVHIAQKLVATRTGKFVSAININTGAVQFEVNHEIAAKVGYRTVDVPATFKLGIRPFIGADLYEVHARFRFRISDNGCIMFYKLNRISDVMAYAVNGLVDEIKRNVDAGVILRGIPSPIKADF